MALLYIGSFVVAFTQITSSQDALTLQLHNYTNPFIVDEGVASEIIFSILGADDVTNYSLALAQETEPSYYTRCSLSVSSAHCWELKRDECQCTNLGQGQRRFKLTVTFEASHVGQWMFAVYSHNVTPVFFNVAFLEQSSEEIHTTSHVLHHTTGDVSATSFYGTLLTEFILPSSLFFSVSSCLLLSSLSLIKIN